MGRGRRGAEASSAVTHEPEKADGLIVQHCNSKIIIFQKSIEIIYIIYIAIIIIQLLTFKSL